MAKYKMHILLCGGTGCQSSGSSVIHDNLQNELLMKGLSDEVQVIRTGCFGFCEKGPIVKVLPDNTFYTQVKPEDAAEIVKEHVVKGRKVARLLYTDPAKNEHISDSKHMGFYRKQIRIALRNCGFINPENIDEYIATVNFDIPNELNDPLCKDDLLVFNNSSQEEFSILFSIEKCMKR